MKLKLEKRGLDFVQGDSPETQNSDVGNFRVISCEKIELKDGRKMLMDFFLGRRCVFKTVHHRDGTESQKMIRHEPKLCCDTEYQRDDGFYYRDSKIEKRILDLNLDYTMENILFVINAYSREYYDEIEFV